MNIVVDASVALKWFFRTRRGEEGIDSASALLRGVADGRYALVQPPHFIAEVSAVLARESPSTAVSALGDLLDIEMAWADDKAIYERAVDLSIRLKQHVFDTLYHAVALELPDAWLVTADDRYHREAKRAGRIVRLADFDPSRLEGTRR